MQKEFKVRLIRHITFLESELQDYDAFNFLSWEQYNADRNKRRNVERWIENIINSSIDIAKIILTAEGLPLPYTYKEVVNSLAVLADFNKENMEMLSRWVRLRNIISHEYLDIRWASIKRFISESRSLFESFLDATNRYLARKEQQDNAETA